MPSEDDARPVNFSAGSARRIARVVRDFEGPGGGGPGARTPSAGWNPGVQRAVVTTAIPTGTMASPSSSGRVTLWAKTGGTWGAAETDVTVWNHNTMPSSIPVGRAVTVCWIAGEWWLNTGSCS